MYVVARPRVQEKVQVKISAFPCSLEALEDIGALPAVAHSGRYGPKIRRYERHFRSWAAQTYPLYWVQPSLSPAQHVR